MKKLLVLAGLAFGITATAQTTTDGVLNVRPGTGVNEVRIHNASVTITNNNANTTTLVNGGKTLLNGSLTSTSTASFAGTVSANGGIIMNGSKITGLKAGTDGNDAGSGGIIWM